ncbi:MAG: phage major capsid protein, partial [Clostridia bacterium]
MNKKMRELLEKIQAKTETAKSFNAEGKIDEASSALTEIAELQKAYDVESKLFDIEMAKVEVPTEPQKAKDTVTEEQKSFVDFCRTAKIEKSLSAGNNGAIIPQSIANKIIEEVVELSPILSKVTMYHAKGTLSIPTYGKDGGDDVMADYAEEFTELQAHQGKFGSVDLSSKLVGALSLISKSLINNTDVDVYNFIVKKMATAISNFLERELLVGDGAAKHMTGAVTTKNLNVLTTKTIAGITADVLIDTQLLIPEAYQKGAEWYMNREVF